MSKECLAFSFCKALCNDTDEISKQRWGTLKKHLERWKGLDKYGDLYDSIDWDAGPTGKYIHRTCGFNIASSRCLELAKKRFEKGKSCLFLYSIHYIRRFCIRDISITRKINAL